MKASSFVPPDMHPVRGWWSVVPTNRVGAVIIAFAYLAAHVPFLAPSLEDIDSINFALGLRAFNPALHQPHPPGHPVYMGLGHVSLAIVERVTSMSRVAAEAWSLAVWSAIGGAASIIAAWMLFAAFDGRRQAAGSRPQAADSGQRAVVWATLLLAVAPLFWMSGLRPMSDVPGLALALGAQALFLHGASRARLVQGALLAGIAAGVRVQTAVLTVPLLAFVLLEARDRRTVWQALVAFGAACLAWAIPLVLASGGIDAYLAALHSQAGEDFAWVDMLWVNPTPRHVAIAFYQTLVLPWASIPLAVAIAVAAAIGALVMLMRDRGALLRLAVAYVPYFVFHVLFQETITLRYFNVFGPRQDPKSQYAAAIPAFVSAILQGEAPIIYGDGEQSRDFTYIDTVVDGNVLAMSAKKTCGEVVNVACGGEITINQVIAAINRALGTNVRPRYADARPGDVRHSCADVRLAKTLLGFVPRVSFDDGLRRAIEYYRSIG